MTRFFPFPLAIYLYTYFYSLGLIYTVMVDSAVNIWVGIEIIIFFLIALVSSESFSQFRLLKAIQYFVLQTLASFIILCSLVVSSYFFLTSPVFMIFIGVAIFVKIAMFPFFYWYFDFTYSLPPFIFFLVLGPQKLAPCIIYLAISTELIPCWDTFLVPFLVVLSLVTSVILSITSIDVRSLLIWSSLANTSWIVLSLYAGELVFILYYWVYLFILFIFCYGMYVGETWISRLPRHTSPYLISSWGTRLQSFSIITITGMPPFPMFFSKFVVIYSILQFTSLNTYLGFTCVIFVLCSFVILLMYVRRLCFLVLNMSVTF